MWFRGAMVMVALLAPSIAKAHPHVEIEVKLALTVEAGGAQFLTVEWLFDDFYSGSIIKDYRPVKGRFSGPEIETIRRKQFENVKQFNYFLQPAYDRGGLIKLPEVRSFTARIEGGRVRYVFSVPLPAPKLPTGLTVVVVDPENFIRFIMPRYLSVAVDGAGKGKFNCSRIRAPDIDSPYGVIEPDAMRCAPTGKS